MKSKSFRVRVSAQYRNAVQSFLNLPDSDLANWKLLEYILFYPVEDKHNQKQIVAHHETIQTITNSIKPAITLLNEFENATGIELNIEAYKTYGNIARTINPSIPSELKKLTRAEIQTPYNQKNDIVFFATGERISVYQERKEREFYLQLIMSKNLSNEHPLYPVIQYLHSHQCLIWLSKRVKAISPQIHEEIARISDESKRVRIERIWHFIEQYSSIEYDYANNTKRIYSCNSNLITIDRSIRQRVFRGCYSLDLKSAHLGIVAKLWDLPLLSQFLQSGKSIWNELFEYCGLNPTEDNKDGLKRCIYAITYGKSQRGNGCTVKQYCIEQLGNSSSVLFLQHPLIKELLKHRDIELERMKHTQGAYNAFGNFIHLDNIHKDTLNSQLRSLLSSTVQSYEVKLMLEAFNVITLNDNLLLTAWIHDGIYVSIKNHKEYACSYIEQIQSTVNSLANSYGFITELEAHEL